MDNSHLIELDHAQPGGTGTNVERAIAGSPTRRVDYVDDFMVLCRIGDLAKEALTVVEHPLTGQLGLSSSPEKAHVTTSKMGFPFLGSDTASYLVKMHTKSVGRYLEVLNRQQLSDIENQERDLLVELDYLAPS